MGCLTCGWLGMHNACKRCRKNKCHPEPVKDVPGTAVLVGMGRRPSNPEDMVDPVSTGRKRAAMLYPLFKDQSCEWKLQKNCGGGKYPIVGCLDGKQQDRQHGPVKDTRRNEPGNVHKICKQCHRRWHVMNDPEYSEEEYSKLPHKPEPATELEVLSSEAMWRLPKNRRLLRSKEYESDSS